MRWPEVMQRAFSLQRTRSEDETLRLRPADIVRIGLPSEECRSEWRIHHSRGKLREMNATDYLQHLVRELAAYPERPSGSSSRRTTRIQRRSASTFAAIANSAALEGKQRGYIVWGVRDADHEIVGTVFKPSSEKVKGQELENWLADRHFGPRSTSEFMKAPSTASR